MDRWVQTAKSTLEKYVAHEVAAVGLTDVAGRFHTFQTLLKTLAN